FRRTASRPESLNSEAPSGAVTENGPVAETTAAVMPSAPMLMRTVLGSAYAGAARAGTDVARRMAAASVATRARTLAAIDLRPQHADEREIAIPLGIVESVPDDELVRNFEAAEIGR